VSKAGAGFVLGKAAATRYNHEVPNQSLPLGVRSMFPTSLKTFVHPGGVYRLEYPGHWDALQQDEGRSCGFGPHERDDVGLWISILPMSVDTEQLASELPRLLAQTLEQKGEAPQLRPDPSLRHYGVKADATKEGEGGNYWVVAGGDVVLFASTQVPAAEREQWNPLFEKVMASLQITREEELFLRKVANEVLLGLRQRYPEQDFEFNEQGIRGRNRVVYLSNLYRQVKASPARREHIIREFIENLSLSTDTTLGEETWEEVREHLLPVLKPKNYIKDDNPTKHILTADWLPDVLICYVIRNKKFYRFVTGWDVNRWGTTEQDLHQLALDNLRRLNWPSRLEGARQRDGGRLILIETGDSLASSRLLHPDLHRLFSGPLGSPFWAGIPDRDTLVVYSDRRALKQRIARRLKKDHDSSAYPITPRPFLVTRDGIALGG
jgi:uncharacterized protein YtpQ (UPF0354 family)